MSDTVSSPAARRWCRRILTWGLLSGVFASGVFVLWFYVLGPQPPEIALPDNDPGAALDIVEARSAVKYWPFRASKWGRLGLVLGKYGFDKEALACLARAAQLRPSNPRWPYLQGILQTRSDLDAGLVLLERSVQLDGSVPTARLVLAETLLRLGRTDEAEEHLQFVLRTDPEDARALLGMGCVARDRGELPASCDYLSRSALLAPRVQGTHALLAEVYQRLGDQEQAELQRARAASLSRAVHWPDPYSSLGGQPLRGQRVIIQRANALLNEDRPQDAIELLNELSKNGVQWFMKDLLLGRAYVNLGDLDAAEKAYREALGLKPDSAEVFLGLAGVLEKQDNFSDAAEYFRKGLQLRPESVSGCYHLARCLEQEGQDAEAIEAYRQAVRLRPGFAPAHKALGRLLEANGEYAEALAALEKACKLAPKDDEARQRLAIVRDRLGLPQEQDGPAENASPAPNPRTAPPDSPD